MFTHELKCIPEFFQVAVNGLKKFEVRKNDRDFKVFQHLLLREYIPELEGYTGRSELFEIKYILKDFVGLAEGYVVLGIEKV